MFILHVSNRTENLLAHLRQVIAAAPLADPFAKEMLMIQSQGMERWLSQQLAAHFQVWANYEFLFPGSFFNRIAQAVDSRLNTDNFARNRILWRLESLLRNVAGEPFRVLQHYLPGDNAELKRYQLARQLAQLFDQYQILRPDLLAAWQRGGLHSKAPEELWQRALWLGLLQQLGMQHRGVLWQETVTKLRAVEAGALAGVLPERIALFGLNTLPPLFLDFLQGIARHTQVHLYLLNPAREYWADLESKRQMARKQLLQPPTQHLPIGETLDLFQPDMAANSTSASASAASTQTGLGCSHPLLAALGQQGREFQQLLLEQAEFNLEFESYEYGEQPTLLQQLQNDILDNRLHRQPLVADSSIKIHACHSRMREVQVLHDQLLHALEADAQLQLRDIVVMAPDIQQYAPFIAAVFANLPHAVADRSLRLSNELLDALLSFLRLAQSRCGWQEVLDLLQRPCVHPSFDLAPGDFELVAHWIEQTRIRWGRSAEHKRQLGLPPQPENTWLAGLQRLLMGLAMGDDSDFVFGILPYQDIEGSSAQALGGLYDYLQLLFAAADDLAKARSLQAWGELLQSYAETLFAGALTETVPGRQLLELLHELGNDVGLLHHEAVAPEAVLAWLEDAVDEQLTASGFLRGSLTFCSMLPMRAIPFKVIALLGLNEGEFPKIDRPPNFDLIAQNFRHGDRSRRADDRYQFLEILLSVRQQLIITYVGQSIRDNRPIPPSVVVDELLEVLHDAYNLTDLVVKHPLQPFSARYFTGNPKLFSFAGEHCATAQALAQPVTAPSVWWQGEIAVDGDADATLIEFGDVLAFYRHPQRYFLQRRLALQLQGIEAAAEEREPFAVAGLDAYALQQRWLAAELAGTSPELDKWQAQGIWPTGALGELERQRFAPALKKFSATVAAKNAGSALPERLFELRIGTYRLTGKLSDRYENGRLIYRYSDLKGKDLLYAWLQHLTGNHLEAQPTYLLSKDADLRFPPALGDTETLLGLIDLYRLGQTRPDVFFTEAALAYLRQEQILLTGSRSTKTALETAQENVLEKLRYDSDLALVLRGRDLSIPVFDAAFENACRDLLLPMWLAVH